jgi:small redox-active disulfide protein 2
MDIRILGPGCSNCHQVEKVTREVLTEMGIEATLTKVTDWAEIRSYGILGTPGLVIDGKVVCSSRIPTKGEVTTWVVNAAMAEGGP